MPTPPLQDNYSQRDRKIDSILEMLVKQQNGNYNRNKLRAPELVLPEFHGEVKTYRSFKDMFHLAVKDIEMTNTQLFVLLKSKLKGKALQAIDSLTINDENYTRAWIALDTCYENQRRLMDDCFDYIAVLR